MPKISERGRRMPESAIRKLVPLADKAVERGLKVYRLNIGQPDIKTPEVAIEALRNIDRKVLEYSPSEGFLSLRKKLCDYYHRCHINVDVEDIIITTGGSEAVLFAFMSTLDLGDEVIMPEPAYANYMAFAIAAGAKIVTVPAKIEDGFKLPPIEEFEKLITPRTKGILICNPNNPTGYIYSREELEELRRIVIRHDLFLYSDEVYREFCYTGVPYVSAFQLEGIEDKVVLIDSVSKRYSECGIRIGALVTKNISLRQSVMRFCQARLSPPLLGQIVAEASADTPEEYMRETYEEYKARRDFFIVKLNSIPGVYSPVPMGAFYTVVGLPVDDADRFCRWCLEEFEYEGQTVFMAPASGFYTIPGLGKNQVRMAYVLEREELSKALDVLAHALATYPHKTN